jgi:hypothetical protein
MHVLWKIFGVSFELLAHNHVEVGAQVFSFGGWRSIRCLSETLSITVVPIEAFRKMLTSSFPNLKEHL